MRFSGLCLLPIALVLGACEDPDGSAFGPGGDANGTWVAETETGVRYVRIMASSIEVYAEVDTCFQVTDYDITRVTDQSFTVVPAGDSTAFVWIIDRDGDALVIDFGATEMTLEPSDVDLNEIPLCGGPVGDFPHPPCTDIPAVAVGGSVNGTLGAGDTQWTDGTWYDLWSLQLASAANVSITMLADDPEALDTYLMLYDEFAVDRLAEDDDIDFGGGNYNSRIITDLQPGCYIIVANSYSEPPDPEAGYNLSVTQN